MNREILFRGKRIDNGEWVYGCLLIDYVTGQYFIHVYGNSMNESDKVNEEGCLRFLAFEVNSETVCQYTGLMDKNGRKIFDGDICRRKIFENIITGKVVWLDVGMCGFHLKHRHHYYAAGKDEYTGKSGDEVIGNIFDNPELIAEEEG